MLVSCLRGKLLGNGRAVKGEAVRLGQLRAEGGGRIGRDRARALELKTVYNGPMDIVCELQGFEFEWDENKARSNVEDHGMAFEEAV
jgi:hypothetical protein